MKVVCDTDVEYSLQQLVHEKFFGQQVAPQLCRSALVDEMIAELTHLKHEFQGTPSGVLRYSVGGDKLHTLDIMKMELIVGVCC